MHELRTKDLVLSLTKHVPIYISTQLIKVQGSDMMMIIY